MNRLNDVLLAEMLPPEAQAHAGYVRNDTPIGEGLRQLGGLWYERLLGEPIGSMKRVGNALLGKADDVSQQDLLNAITLYSGPGILTGRPNASLMSIFGGRGAKTANQNALRRAEKMLVEKADNEVIRNKTGWHKGMDNKWRFEIDDSKLTLKEDGPWYGLYTGTKLVDLDEIIDHEDLFRAYPELKEMQVVNSGSELLKEHRGYMSGNRIGVSDEAISDAAAGDDTALKQILVHEIQHAVQREEGFARGANPAEFAKPGLLPDEGVIRQAQILRSRHEKTGISIDDLAKRPAPRIWYDGEWQDAAIALAKNPEKLQKRKDDLFYSKNPTDAYYNTAGEIEARDAASRINRNWWQRKGAPVDLRENAIIRFHRRKPPAPFALKNGAQLIQ